MDARFYVVQYRQGEFGCPHFLSGAVNRDEWEWPMYVGDPFSVSVERDYIYQLADSNDSVDFYFYGSQTNFVSEQFLQVCDAMKVRYRAISLRITCDGKDVGDKRYSIFLSAEHAALLDRSSSEFLEDRDMESGEIAENNLFPGTPMYSWIKRFVPRDDCTSALFRSVEIMELVCNEKFKGAAERAVLKGVEFIPIDSNYIYDLWGEAS
ncbi:hypothetical protein [Burkholderia ubonensis]|uniref:hypothetical protein n=1 Tax=Burkholderia ubonensis TaxID=101571 RepID=UPI000B10B51D|nr:hypothetical protein [Burkholderia ubonensis]